MKKIFLAGSAIILLHTVILSQNVGIGTSNPGRARLVLHGAVGHTTAIFGGETTGISLQSNFPTIGFNEYYNNGHRYIAGGYAAQQFFDPASGYLAFDLFAPGNANAVSAGQRRLLTMNYSGDIIAGNGNTRLSINTYPAGDGIHNATLQIRQTVEGNNEGITLSDMDNIITWRISSKNNTDGILALGLNGWNVGFFNSNGDYYALSDSRLKSDTNSLAPVLGKIMQLRPLEYKMKQNNSAGRVSVGFLAQDVKELFPALVHVLNDTQSAGKGPRNLHAVSYAGFGVIAIKAVQEQQQQIGLLQARIEALEKGLINGHVK